MLFFVLKLLFNFSCPTVVFLKGLFAVQLGLSHSIMHTLDFCLLLRYGSFVAIYFLQKLLYLLIKSFNLTLEFHLSFPYFLFSLVSFILELLKHLGMISLFLCNLWLELLIHRLYLTFMILLQTRYCCFMFISYALYSILFILFHSCGFVIKFSFMLILKTWNFLWMILLHSWHFRVVCTLHLLYLLLILGLHISAFFLQSISLSFKALSRNSKIFLKLSNFLFVLILHEIFIFLSLFFELSNHLLILIL